MFFFDSRLAQPYTLVQTCQRTGRPLSTGLPQEHAFIGTYREGMAVDSIDPVGVYVGTNTGEIFASNDEGDSWYVLADNLPPVYSVSVDVLE
jgi:hypothetical protein